MSEEDRARARHWRLKYPERSLHRLAQKRSVQRGTLFTLRPEDIKIPKRCPVLGIELRVGNRELKDNSPTLDEIIPGKGYIKGNVRVISWRANRLKSDASLEEITKVQRYMKKGWTLKDEWLGHGWKLAAEKAEFYSGARKIIRGRAITFSELDDSLQLSDAGYTKSKMTMLRKNYLHEESKAVAIELWDKRLGQRKYGSVSFTCFNHFVKGGAVNAKRSKRASVFGPCIQSVVLTYLNDHTVSVDVMYRTTEWFKKFPADLVFLREELLAGFDFAKAPISEITCHFANITIHPMYAVSALACDTDPIGRLEKLRKKDEYFFNWTIKWTARYLCPEHHRGIQKFAQAMRVCKDARERISPDIMPDLIAYLNKWHPGYKNDYTDPDEENEE